MGGGGGWLIMSRSLQALGNVYLPNAPAGTGSTYLSGANSMQAVLYSMQMPSLCVQQLHQTLCQWEGWLQLLHSPFTLDNSHHSLSNLVIAAVPPLPC
jgi:hypothetical protein